MKCKSILCLIALVTFVNGNVVCAKTTYDFSAGDRKDEVNFNFAGDMDGKNPNVQSELKWTDLKNL